MAIASDSFTGVDLSRLPPPNVVEPLDFETIRSRNLARFQELFAEFDALVESDPAIKWIELSSYQELILRQRVNDAARACMAPYATGADLDNLVALFGIERFVLDPGNPAANPPVPPTYETDPDLRRRAVLAPEGYSVAGPPGAYIFHTLSASSDVLDASVDSPEPDDIKALVMGTLADHDAEPALVDAMTAALDTATWPGVVEVTVLSRTGDGTADADLLEAVTDRLNDGVRPLTDHVVVASAEIVPYLIEAETTYLAGPDRSLVRAEQLRRINAHVEQVRLLGRDVTRAGIIAALHPEGVQNLNLISPSEDIVISRVQAGHCTGIDLIDMGIGE